jgi:RNA polymerase sigma-70 factor (ECF subfamily)
VTPPPAPLRSPERCDALATAWEEARPELVGYLSRLVTRHEVAEELAQETAARMLESSDVPRTSPELRAWLFRVATNLAIDHLRRHAVRRERVLDEARRRAEGDPGFVAESRALAGTPETAAVAREHLAVCVACTLRNLPPHQAAALLLREVHGVGLADAARALDARDAQVKGWIQAAREALSTRYEGTCALVGKQGACYQCVELDGFFGAGRGDPLAGTDGGLDARLAVLRDLRGTPQGRWHRHMLALVGDLLDGE